MTVRANIKLTKIMIAILERLIKIQKRKKEGINIFFLISLI